MLSGAWNAWVQLCAKEPSPLNGVLGATDEATPLAPCWATAGLPLAVINPPLLPSAGRPKRDSDETFSSGVKPLPCIFGEKLGFNEAALFAPAVEFGMAPPIGLFTMNGLGAPGVAPA